MQDTTYYSLPGQTSKPYDRLSDEPVCWFGRFSRFCLMGQKGRRSPLAVWKQEQTELASEGRLRPEKAGDFERLTDVKSVPGSWARAMRRWDWWSRAASYDIDRIAEERQIVEESRAARRRELLDREWHDGQLMVEEAHRALSYAPLFYERTTKFIPGEFVETEITDPRTGETVITRVRTDREIVYLPHRIGDIRRLFMDGGRLRRLSVGMTSQAAQEAFERQEAGVNENGRRIEDELREMWEHLGFNRWPVERVSEDSRP